MPRDINGKYFFTPSDVDPPLYMRVHMHKKGNWMDAIILIIFAVGIILTLVSL